MGVVSGAAGEGSLRPTGSAGARGPRRIPVRVHVSSHLHAYTGGAATVDVEVEADADASSGVTLGHVLRALGGRCEGIRFRLVDEQDRLRPHMSFFVGARRVRSLDAAVAPGDEVHLLGALSGG